MDFRFVLNPMTLNDLERSNSYTITGTQNVIRWAQSSAHVNATNLLVIVQINDQQKCWRTDQETTKKTLLEMRLKGSHVGAPLKQLPGGILERLTRNAELL